MDYKTYLKKIMSEDEINLMIKEYEKKPVTSLRLNLLKFDNDKFEGLYKNLAKHNHVKEAYYYDKELFAFGKNPFGTDPLRTSDSENRCGFSAFRCLYPQSLYCSLAGIYICPFGGIPAEQKQETPDLWLLHGSWSVSGAVAVLGRTADG